MNIKIIFVVIFVLLVLIAGTFFGIQPKTENVPQTVTDFSAIGSPIVTPGKTFLDLLSGTPDPVQQKVLDNVYLDEYYLYPCTVNKKTTDVVVLVAKYKQNSEGINSFSNAEMAVKSFETEMYKKWGGIIYKESFQPNLSTKGFSDETLNNDQVLPNSYRVGTLSDNSTKIYYGWVLNYIIVAASKECLVGTMGSVYDMH